MTIRAVAFPVFDPGGIASQKAVHSVNVMQTESMHDTAIITLRGADTSLPELQPGIPVQMQYGWQSADLDWFYGYIDHVETHYDRSIPTQSELEDVVCLGASYSLKDPFLGAWTSIQASSLVKKIASEYFLSSVVEIGDTVWPQIASPGDSAWIFLSLLARKLGYTLACNKTLLRFISIDLGLQNYWSTMPVFQSRNAQPNYVGQTIVQFCSVTTEAATLNGKTKRVRHLSGIDLATNQIFDVRDDGIPDAISLGQTNVVPFFSEQVSSTVTSTQGDAAAILAGMYQGNRFNYQATAIISGLTSVRQGVPIVIKGIDSNNDGIWWVQEAIHKIRPRGYTIDVSLGRDAVGDTGTLPVQGSSVMFTPSNPYAYVIANAPPTRLVNNRWRAAFATNVSVA